MKGMKELNYVLLLQFHHHLESRCSTCLAFILSFFFNPRRANSSFASIIAFIFRLIKQCDHECSTSRFLSREISLKW